jgi:diguanylate cyclase (GGDEF)-like protein/PAS domain S-box-containing protein
MTGALIGLTALAAIAAAAAGVALFVLVRGHLATLRRRHEESEARFRSLVKNSSDVVAVVGADTTIRYVSPSCQRVLGYRTSELEGTAFIDLVHEGDAARVRSFVVGPEREGPGGAAPIEFRLRRRDDEWIEVETLRTNLLADPAVGGIVLNTRDISERKSVERQLEHHAFYDALTGLANRALFHNRVTHALGQAERTRRTVAVVFMDLDDFKIVNDSFGHAVGDQLLRGVAERLKTCLRDSDTAARLGGDEFAVLLEEETDDGDGAAEVGERILRAFDTPIDVDGQEQRVRVSLGIAFGSRKTGEEATEELLRNADVAMYTAKGEGKGRCAIYQPTMHKTLLQRLALKGELPRALENGEFVLHYQPLVTLETGAITGLEALVRWEHPERGTIPPLEFIPLTEETGLIIPLGAWILQTACETARDLQAAFPQDPPLGMSVNLSLRQLQSPSVVTAVRDALESTGIAPSSLTLEVTESVMMQNVEISVLRLRELKQLGVHIAIDDFGAGYSSLSYIRQFPVDVFKVDKAFIDRIDQDGEELALTAAIIGLAKVLNLRPLAEGVERPEQLAKLLELGCGSGQGYFFARPETKADIVTRLEAVQHQTAA